MVDTNGLITDKSIYGIPFKQDLISKGTRGTYASKWTKIKPEYITIHNTGNKDKGADAKMHTKYIDNVENSYVSWHFTVDDTCIFQELPIIYNAWHCTDGSSEKSGNMTSIGIEICETGEWKKSRENGIKLICYLMGNVPWLRGDNWEKTIVPHKYWKSKTYPTGKDCPRIILAEPGGFNKFVKDCIAYNKELQKPKNPYVNSTNIKWLYDNKLIFGENYSKDDIFTVDQIGIILKRFKEQFIK